jgi:hypothetical protein
MPRTTEDNCMDKEKDLELIASSWSRVVKASLFDGGPSSTRWVYVITGTCVSISVVVATLVFCLVYMCSANHVASGVVATFIGTTIGALFGFASHAQNVRNDLTEKTDQQ